MNLCCPNCDTPIPAQNINVQQMVAVCPKCSHVFNFASDHQPKRLKRKVKAPEEITVRSEPDKLIITVPWSVDTETVLGVSVFAAGIACLLLVSVLQFEPVTSPNFIKTLVLSVIVVGAIVKFITSLHSNTTIRVTSHHLVVHGGEEIVSGYTPTCLKEDMQQLYCKQRVYSHRGNSKRLFELRCLMTDGTDMVLVSGLRENQALYLEYVLEDYLGIEDMPVRGEY